MFHSLESPKNRVKITVDGKHIEVDATANVAMALLGAGITAVRRSVVGNAPRAP